MPTIYTKGMSQDQLQAAAMTAMTDELVPRSFWESLDGMIGLMVIVS